MRKQNSSSQSSLMDHKTVVLDMIINIIFQRNISDQTNERIFHCLNADFSDTLQRSFGKKVTFTGPNIL